MSQAGHRRGIDVCNDGERFLGNDGEVHRQVTPPLHLMAGNGAASAIQAGNDSPVCSRTM
jgi:hypothetical protein